MAGLASSANKLGPPDFLGTGGKFFFFGGADMLCEVGEYKRLQQERLRGRMVGTVAAGAVERVVQHVGSHDVIAQDRTGAEVAAGAGVDPLRPFAILGDDM